MQVKISYYRHIFWKNKYLKRLNSRKWTPEKNWHLFDSWKMIPSVYNFMTHKNKYLRKIVLRRQLDIFLSLKTLLQGNNILSMFLSVWTRKRRKNQNTASNYTTNWNQISSNVNEVIRPVLNFFFHNKILHAQKAQKEYKAPKA